MPYSSQDKKRAITRLRRIRGQAEALESRIAEGVTCGEVLQQLAAIRGGINGLMGDVLEGHLRESFGAVESTASTRLSAQERKLQLAIEEAARLVRSYLK